ncbi:MAG: transcriptional regulator NrdR [Oscillospiraceae bacterium]
MKCPYCGSADTKVIDSRPADDDLKIRRRRECISCEKRFTTYETIETIPIMIIKKDGSRERFNRNKLLNGMLRACEKRAVSINTLEAAVDRIDSLDREIATSTIGELVMEQLKSIDDVAYVRFASVYREFKDINTFMDELKGMLKKKR